MIKDQTLKLVNSIKSVILIAFGWGFFRANMQVNILIREGNKIMPIWFLVELLMAVLASSLFVKLERSLKTWITSIFFSILIIIVFIASPVAFGILDPPLVSILIGGSMQLIVTILLLSTPIDLLGCFLGQIFRNRLIQRS